MLDQYVETIARQRIHVQGIVQGVGFRPFVYALASDFRLGGFVLNDSNGVTIEIEGEESALAAFLNSLETHAPPLSQIHSISTELLAPLGENEFLIRSSQKGDTRRTLISPDVATCDDCLRELFDPADRRYLYPFINCTNCGPRFTIVQDVPYDREKTTMRVFPLCPDCQAEYENPFDRRFHAQPNACPVCGPEVRLVVSDQYSVSSARKMYPSQSGNTQYAIREEAIQQARLLLDHGKILALKGLGGYHLACDATNEEAVARLRQRKHREAKPFALMVKDLETARQLCFINEAEAALLTSRRRPIVLLRQRPGNSIAPSVAPAYNTLGLMLPYTPLHHLLFADSSQPSTFILHPW